AGRVALSGEPMAAGPAPQGSQGSEGQAASRRQAAVEPSSTTQAGAASFARPVSGWLCHGSLDVSARRASNSRALRRDLSPRTHLALAASVGLDLPEARAAGARAGRSRDRALATRG